MKKCKVTKKLEIKPCNGLNMALERTPSRNQGIQFRQYASLETGNHTRNGVDIKCGAKDRGLAFNYCPFCGVEIATHAMEAV